MLTAADRLFYAGIRHGGTAPHPRRRHHFPLCRTRDFTGLPMTLAIGAECDPLADDARRLCRRDHRRRGQGPCRHGTGLVHGYLRARAIGAPRRRKL